ncbi:MAG: Flp family type IVb pilin [Rhodopila sp.]|jgi:Flp pilus assembly pilin Flp
MTFRILQAFLALRSDKRAVTIIEYALIAALIGVALIGTLTSLEGKISSSLSTIGASL